MLLNLSLITINDDEKESYFLLGSIFFSGLNSHAQISSLITLSEVESAANHWLKDEYPKDEIKIKSVMTKDSKNGYPVLYEVVSDSISLLFSGSRNCQPLLGVYVYPNSSLLNDYDSLPCGLVSLLESYIEQIEQTEMSGKTDPDMESEWNNLIKGESSSHQKRRIIVSPLIKSYWGQSKSNYGNMPVAYNYYVRPGTHSETGAACDHCLVGCVAVAVGQVMNYWTHPILSTKIPHQYNWCNMSNILDGYSPMYGQNRDAVAYLLADCGERLNTTYHCDKSSAPVASIRTVLVNSYMYNNSAKRIKRDTVNNNTWISILKTNLNNKKPVIYVGYGSSGGHAFICDGYDNNGYFHFNWGWTDDCNNLMNDYFSLSQLSPSGSDFSYRQEAVFNIYPDMPMDMCSSSLLLDDFYGPYSFNGEVAYEIAPQTMTTLTSASASSPQSWRTIPAGATAVYQAHEEVILQDGFEAEAGCEFEARIEPCALCDEAGNSMQGANLPEGMASVGDQPDTTGGTVAYAMGQPQELPSDALFPNPTDGPLTMSTDGMAQAVLVYTLSGNPVGGWRIVALTETSLSLDVSALAPGTYLLSVASPTGTRTAKFIRR